MQEATVLLERLAVIGREDDEGLGGEPQLVERVEQGGNGRIVHAADARVVEIGDVADVTGVVCVDRGPEVLVAPHPAAHTGADALDRLGNRRDGSVANGARLRGGVGIVPFGGGKKRKNGRRR